jgi:hypothetical protein
MYRSVDVRILVSDPPVLGVSMSAMAADHNRLMRCCLTSIDHKVEEVAALGDRLSQVDFLALASIIRS